MSFLSGLRSIHSPHEFPAFEAVVPAEARPVEMVLDLERLGRERPNFAWFHPERRDMWRFGGLLPLDIADENDLRFIVTLGEGCTPLLPFDDHPLSRKAGFRLRIKDEGEHHEGFGSNPTHSFKDRGMAVVVSMARRTGVSRLVAPTQGNAGDSLVTYALAAGLEAAVVAPENTPGPILESLQSAARLHDSIYLDLVSGTVREAGVVVREKYLPLGYLNMATFQEPGWRIEGKKTMGLELAEPRTAGGKWELPDVVVYPTGGGTGIVGMWKAFAELEQLGVIDPGRPRMVAVQSAATAPIVRAFNDGQSDTEPAPAGETMAVGLNVPYSMGHRRVLEILRESGGAAVAVSEEQIRTALSGRYPLSPEGAACLASLEELVDRRIVSAGDSVVLFNTASYGKYRDTP